MVAFDWSLINFCFAEWTTMDAASPSNMEFVEGKK